jgi:UDP-glucuronate decarboxylase
MLELVKRTEAALGRAVRHRVVEYPDSYPADEPQRRCPDIRKARQHLDFEPVCTLEEGLRRFLGWTDHAFTGTA